MELTEKASLDHAPYRIGELANSTLDDSLALLTEGAIPRLTERLYMHISTEDSVSWSLDAPNRM